MKDRKLTESVPENDASDESDDDVRERLDKLERKSQESQRLFEQRIILAELKVEATRAGIIDLDGLKFLDTAQIHLDEDGGIVGGANLISKLKHAKPWLFATPSSSSIAKVPPSGPARQKLATEMSDSEYRLARANILRRSAF